MFILSRVDKTNIYVGDVFKYTVDIFNKFKSNLEIRTFFPKDIVYKLPVLDNMILSININKKINGDYITFKLNSEYQEFFTFDILCYFNEVKENVNLITEISIYEKNKLIEKKEFAQVICKNINIEFINEMESNLIIYNGDKDIIIGSDFDPYKNVYAIDYFDKDISDNIVIIKNDLDINKLGTYEILYTVMDDYENSTSYSVLINVIK